MGGAGFLLSGVQWSVISFEMSMGLVLLCTAYTLKLRAMFCVAGECAWYVLSGTCWLLGGAWFQCSYEGFWMSSCWLMFPGVRSSLVFSGFEFKPPASGFQSYSYSGLKTSPSPFKDNGLLFWVPDVFCQHSEIVLCNFLSVHMFFWCICGGESGLPILFLCHLRTASAFI